MGLVVLALVQLAAPPVIAALGGGAFTTADRAGEPAIVPAGHAFSIWLVIEVLSLLWAMWAAVPGGPDPDLRERIARPLTVVFAGFTATATAVALLRWTGVLLPYLGAVVWALAGAVLGARGAGEPVLALGAAVGLVVVIVAALGIRRRGLHLRWAGPGRRQPAEG
ncbi:hypothetical protein ACQP04_03050 [Pseudonocardia halophobica]|uniref:hypothetical protein n=1 Tax=Pseudonocardia halophobica TaxID=29401 RepID=UPI003D8D3CB5